MTIRTARQLFISFLAVVSAPGLSAPGIAQENPPPARTERFTFHDDLRLNLHHFLINWASAEAGQRPPYAVPLRERDEGLANLTRPERTIWSEAVETYARTVDRSLVFDEGLVAVRNHLAGVDRPGTVLEEDRVLLETIESVLDVYRRHWWPAHRDRNEAWIGALTPLLEVTETGIAGRLERAYGTPWPDQSIRVDVVAYANAVGAYSTDGIVTISSLDRGNQVPQAVELVFHEASHVDPLEPTLQSLVDRAFRAEGREAPDRFWHDVIFLTTGDATRLEIAARGLGEYRHYGSFGLYRRDERWPPELRAFEAAWRPFLESGSDREADRLSAMRGVARNLAP